MEQRLQASHESQQMKRSPALDLGTILNSLHNRREFLKLFGKGLGYSALASTLPACGGGEERCARIRPTNVECGATFREHSCDVVVA